MHTAPLRTPPAALRRAAERTELRRIAYLAVIRNAEAGGLVNPVVLAEARAFVQATPALGRPLGTGEPETVPGHATSR